MVQTAFLFAEKEICSQSEVKKGKIIEFDWLERGMATLHVIIFLEVSSDNPI